MQYLVYDPNWTPDQATPPTPEFLTEMGAFIAEAMEAGMLVTTGAAAAQGARLRLTNGTFSVTDGPFIELKELTGGFAVIKADTLEDAVAWCKRFRQIVGDGETEIVPIYGPQ